MIKRISPEQPLYRGSRMPVGKQVSTVTRPDRELRGFRRIFLKAGESRDVILPVTPDHPAFYDRSMKRVVEPGLFEIMVGPDSVNHQTATLRVTA